MQNSFGGHLRIGLFGGSFDPVHNGHLRLASVAFDLAELDKVLFIPARVPPHKVGRSLAEPRHRLAMLTLALQDCSKFEISEIEVHSIGNGYSLDTVRQLRLARPADEFFFIIGGDSLVDLHKWYRIDELLYEVRFLILNRPGFDIEGSLASLPFDEKTIDSLRNGMLSAPALDVSSSQIRKMIERQSDISGLVPDEVRKYILENGLYLNNKGQ